MSEDYSNGANGEGLSFVDLGDTQSGRVYLWRSGALQPDKWARPVSDFSHISMTAHRTILRGDVEVGGGGVERNPEGVAWPTGVQRFGKAPS